jgi:hypothetical protein
MPPITLKSLKPVSNLLRTYCLRMPVHRRWGRRRFWQLSPLLLAMRSSHNTYFFLSLSGAAADQGFGAADQLQGVDVNLKN